MPPDTITIDCRDHLARFEPHRLAFLATTARAIRQRTEGPATAALLLPIGATARTIRQREPQQITLELLLPIGARRWAIDAMTAAAAALPDHAVGLTWAAADRWLLTLIPRPRSAPPAD